MGSNRELIADRLRREIQAGRLRPGDRLPSVREIATSYNAAPNTASQAVRLLASEGLVILRPKSSAVVAAPSSDPRTVEVRMADAKDQLRDVQDALRDAQHRLANLEHQVGVVLDDL